MQNLYNILNILSQKISSTNRDYYIPSVWITEQNKNFILEKTNDNQTTCKVNFPQFIISQIKHIINYPEIFANPKNPTIYNILVRYFTSFDHLGDKIISNVDGEFKETGTFLKTIALLPYLKKLGVNILYLLPITSIGKNGMKGNLGSPYSIHNPYQLDDNLSEPLLDISIEQQFTALIEAAHCLGIKVICEFIFRTSSKDSTLAIKHPDWFYWIKENIDDKHFCSPAFSQEELKIIKEKIDNENFSNLPEPNIEYQKMFTEPPVSVQITNGKLIGTCADGQKVKIPGAFADYPPDDIQPAWSDVTYLKLYDNNDYNYIAYNTVRMYDNELKKNRYEVTPLWRHIENIIPYYQDKFGIDGVMIDMGHALPHNLLNRIVAKARRNNSDFLFLQENFVPTYEAIRQGFNLVLGSLPFDEHNPKNLKNFISRIEKEQIPIPFFATPETHNTPRAAFREGGVNFSKLIYLVNKLLPLPTFIHSGYELGETLPINTGLGFENIDTTNLTADVLPLFSISAMNWNNPNNIIDFIKIVNLNLNEYIADTDNLHTKNILKLIDYNITNQEANSDYYDKIVVLERVIKNKNERILLVLNFSNNLIDISINTQFVENISQLIGTNNFQINNNNLYVSLVGYGFSLFIVK